MAPASHWMPYPFPPVVKVMELAIVLLPPMLSMMLAGTPLGPEKLLALSVIGTEIVTGEALPSICKRSYDPLLSVRSSNVALLIGLLTVAVAAIFRMPLPLPEGFEPVPKLIVP